MPTSCLEFTLQYSVASRAAGVADDESTSATQDSGRRVASSTSSLRAASGTTEPSPTPRCNTPCSSSCAIFAARSVDELVAILRKRFDEEEENFETSPTFGLTQMNRYSIKWLSGAHD